LSFWKKISSFGQKKPKHLAQETKTLVKETKILAQETKTKYLNFFNLLGILFKKDFFDKIK